MSPDTPDSKPFQSPEAKRFTDTADKFYGGSSQPTPTPPTQPPAATPGERPEPKTDDEYADTLYGEPRALVSSYGPHLMDSMNDLRDRRGLTPQQVEQEIEDTTLVFHDANIQPEQGAVLHKLLVKAIVNPPDDATVQQWATESRRQLRERYGPEEAARRMQVAEEFVKNRPDLARVLAQTGMGSHPDVVLALTDNPNALRLTPKPRKTKSGGSR